MCHCHCASDCLCNGEEVAKTREAAMKLHREVHDSSHLCIGIEPVDYIHLQLQECCHKVLVLHLFRGFQAAASWKFPGKPGSCFVVRSK